MIPRPYQLTAIDNLRQQVRRGKRSIILCAATGSGKTACACMMIEGAVAKGNRAVFLAPRRELIRQTSEHLVEFGLLHGVILAGWDSARNDDAPVQVASKDTLVSRVMHRNRLALPPADVLIVDECHLSAAPTHRKLIERFRSANERLVIIGLSATPGRADGKGLGDVYDVIVPCSSYEELIDQGYLVPVRVFAPTFPDMRRVKAAEWDRKADEQMRKSKLVGDVVDHWKRLAEGRRTVVFASSVAHSIFLRDAFVKAGIRCGHIDDSTPLDEREQALKDLDSGAIEVLCNCAILTMGWDQPKVSCVVLACPTRSVVKYRQCAGRAMRPYPGKQECLVIDHAGAVVMHGFPDEDMEWPLEKSRDIEKEHKAARLAGKIREPMVCVRCGCAFTGRPDCPNCGHRMAKKGREIAVKHGLLTEAKRKKQKPWGIEDASYDIKLKFWKRCLATQAWRGCTVGSAAAMFASQVGSPPWEHGVTPIPVAGSIEWKRPVHQVYPQFHRQTMART